MLLSNLSLHIPIYPLLSSSNQKKPKKVALVVKIFLRPFGFFCSFFILLFTLRQAPDSQVVESVLSYLFWAPSGEYTYNVREKLNLIKLT